MSTLNGYTQICDTQAITHFTGVFSDVAFAHDVAPSFSCNEVDALAGLLTALGETDAAQLWSAAHATADEIGDRHHVEAVEEYVVPVDPMDDLQCDSCQ
jgi:hypothetical protein